MQESPTRTPMVGTLEARQVGASRRMVDSNRRRMVVRPKRIPMGWLDHSETPLDSVPTQLRAGLSCSTVPRYLLPEMAQVCNEGLGRRSAEEDNDSRGRSNFCRKKLLAWRSSKHYRRWMVKMKDGAKRAAAPTTISLSPVVTWLAVRYGIPPEILAPILLAALGFFKDLAERD